MRINHLLVSLVAVAACADAPPPGSTDHAYREVVIATPPVTKELPHAEAVQLCGAEAHAPTLVEMTQQLLGDCATTARGFACVPLATEIQGQVWTSTPCEIGGVHGFFIGSFDTGEVFCGAANASSAQPLCVH